MISDVTRENPMVFNDSPKRDILKLRYDFSGYLEQGISIQLPENTFLLTKYGYFSLFFAWDGPVLEVLRSVLIPEQKNPAGRI